MAFIRVSLTAEGLNNKCDENDRINNRMVTKYFCSQCFLQEIFLNLTNVINAKA